MKKLIFIFFMLATFSCEKKDVQKQNDLYTEWKWEKTLYSDGDVYSSAQKMDTTYYYNFKSNGTLEIKDINQTVKYKLKFEITENEQNHGVIMYKNDNNSEIHFIYSIKNDKLKLSNVEGIMLWINVFKAVGQ